MPPLSRFESSIFDILVCCISTIDGFLQNARALRDWSRRRVSMMVIRQHQISAHFAQKQQAVPQEFYPEHVIGDLCAVFFYFFI
jgi:hypothetical protein